MRIPRHIYDGIFDQARAELPNECCGLVGGSREEAATLYLAKNAEASPFRYVLDPQDQFRITREIEERGEELAAIYHSHTRSEAYPSQTDINLALTPTDEDGGQMQVFPGTIYLIASLADAERPLRGFDIDGEGVTEVELEIE